MLRLAQLLVLVAVTTAQEEQRRCFSESLGRHFNNDDVFTEPGCIQAQCSNGIVVELNTCDPVLSRSGCTLTSDTDAAYPGCCSTVECPKPCFSKPLLTQFKHGEEWTETGCVRASCSDGYIDRQNCPLSKPGLGCKLVQDLSAPYPSCCLSFDCPKPDQCYSIGLQKVFDDGAEWSETMPCQRSRCEKGRVTSVPCASADQHRRPARQW